MSVLPDYVLHQYGTELVQPFNPERVQPASIDLCLYNEFIVFDSHEDLFIDLDDVQDRSARKVTKQPGQGFTLHPGEFILGATQELVTCPDNIMARLEGKSSIGRLGLMIHVTAGFVDPGWAGRLTLEIYNVRKIPIILRPGKPFCQISFHQMLGPATNPYNGRYQGDVSVAASRYGAVLNDVDQAEKGQLLNQDWSNYSIRINK